VLGCGKREYRHWMVRWSGGYVLAILLSCYLVDCKARRFARLDLFLVVISLFLTTVDLFAVDMYPIT
jgi:hypothetical protein